MGGSTISSTALARQTACDFALGAVLQNFDAAPPNLRLNRKANTAPEVLSSIMDEAQEPLTRAPIAAVKATKSVKIVNPAPTIASRFLSALLRTTQSRTVRLDNDKAATRGIEALQERAGWSELASISAARSHTHQPGMDQRNTRAISHRREFLPRGEPISKADIFNRSGLRTGGRGVLDGAVQRKGDESFRMSSFGLYPYLDGIKTMSVQEKTAEDTVELEPYRLDASRFSSANRRRLSAPGLRTFLAITDLWGLADDDRRMVLGLPPRSTYYNWVKAVREHRDITLDVDVLTRISAVLGIHQALGVLHSREREAIAWLRGPHRATVFGGQPPLALVVSGTQDGLLLVRRFLDAARGGLYMAPNDIDRGFRPYRDEEVVFT